MTVGEYIVVEPLWYCPIIGELSHHRVPSVNCRSGEIITVHEFFYPPTLSCVLELTLDNTMHFEP